MDDWSYGIVETRSNAEAQAERSLIDLGYDPLLIRYKKLLRGSRTGTDGRRVRSRKDELVERPFIPGYLFLPIHPGDDCTLVDTARGVRRLFRHRDAEGYLAKPKLIRGRLVELVKAAALEKDETPKPIRDDLRKLLDDGKKPTVRDPGTGMIGHLVSLDDKGRAEWMTNILGRDAPGTIEDASKLELVDA